MTLTPPTSSPPGLRDKFRFFILIAIMMLVALLATGITLYILYETAFEQNRERLVEAAQSRARVIEAVGKYSEKFSTHDLPGGAFSATLGQIRDAHKSFQGFGESGEFTLARREGDHIVFLLRHRHEDLGDPKSVPFVSELAEPMRRALSGQSGTVVGLDYRGEMVLAAYEPVGFHRMGIVAKIDLMEIRAPFIRAALLACIGALILIAVGAVIFLKITSPIIQRLRRHNMALGQKIEERELAEQARSESERRLVILMSNLPGLAYRCSNVKQWTMEFLSEGCRQLTGYAPEALLGNKDLSYADLIHPDDREAVWETIQEAVSQMSPFALEYRIRTASGEERWVWEHGVAIESPDNDRVILEGYITDITERKLAEQALQYKESLLRKVFDLLPVGVWIADKDGTLLRGNAAGIRIWGGSPLVSQEDYSVFKARRPPSYEEVEPEDWALAHTINESATVTDELLEIEAYDGVKRIVLNSTTPVLDEEGKIQAAVIVNHDITERVLAEDALRKSEALHRTLVEAIPDLVWLKDPEGIYLSCNHSFEQFFGAKEKEIIGKTDYDFVDKDLADFFRTHDRKAMKAGGPSINEEWLTFADTQYHGLFETIKSPMLDVDGTLIGVLGVARDITDRKRTEEALSEREALLNEVGNIAQIGGWEMDLVSREAKWTKGTYDIVEIEEGQPVPGPDEHIHYYLPEFHPVIKEKMRKLIEEDIPLDFEAILKTAKGNIKWCRAMGRAIRENGECVKLYGTFQDITKRVQADSKLREKEKLLTEMSRIAKIGGWAFDPVSGKGNWTDEVARIHDLEPGVETNLEIGMSFYVGESRTVIEAAVQRAIEFGEPYDVELELVSAKGIHKWARSIGRPVIVGGKTVMVTGTFQDISVRKEAQAALQKSEEQYRLLADNTLDVIWTMNLELEFTYVNAAVSQLTGYRPDEWIGSRLPDHCDEEHFLQMGAIIAGEIANGPKAVGVVFETEIIKKNQETIFVEIHGKVIFGENGEPVALQGVTRDITERKIVEEALQKSEEKYRLVAENASDNIWVLSLEDLRFTYISPSSKRIFGYTPEESMGMELSEHMPAEGIKIIQTALAEELEKERDPNTDKGRSRVFELEQYVKGGGKVWTEVKTSFIRNEDDIPVSVLGISRNITERKRAETERVKLEDQLRQSQKMEAIGRLAGGVAHDFNNLLTGINGYSEMILAGLETGDPLYEDMEEILNAGQRASALTSQLLAFSRKQVIDPKVIQPNEILERSQKMLRRIIGEDIDLRFLPASDLGHIKADPAQLDQILVNLAVNARDAMPDGGKLTIATQNVTLDEEYCSIHAETKPGDYVRMTVSDNGTGMDAETLEHIFEPFYSTKEKGKGTGLGLSTVYGIMKQNNGFVTVYSELNSGTSFKNYFPLVKDKVEEITGIANVEFPKGTETVLLVEDEEMVRGLAKKILIRQGYQVLEAISGGDALLQCEKYEGPIHLLLTDVIMPGMNGRELHENMQKLKPGLKSLFMSGYTEDVIAHHGVLDHGVAFIQKPFTIEALAQNVRKILDTP